MFVALSIVGIGAVAESAGCPKVSCGQSCLDFILGRAKTAAFSDDRDEAQTAALDVLECLQYAELVDAEKASA